MVTMVDPIMIEGWAEFNRSVRKINADLPKMLRLVANDAANIVVDWAKPKVPSRTGGAARTVKAKSTRTEARVSGGSKAKPYYPWLDFGGRVGPKRSVKREFIKEGRYLYAGLAATNDDVHKALIGGLLSVVDATGIEVEGG
jgi:hypothetical protein